ncbi:HD domain-containing protein [Acidaminobacter sp. JC074]|uniref:HD domain-containing protein n=1 Tax=Acidaminobacter sp. JC074 TaxID=2530199 RepID=UPI001F110AA9|nr:HD domain-containing protein [Acidaminobacter sp. JC074]MCH4887968.1 HD domain-containing protein [Acidaminobacter sp. JC074]
MSDDLLRIIEFISEAEKIKSVLRSGNTSLGRKESTAEHSWRLSLLIMFLSDYLPELDALKALQLSIIHDLGELDEGDIPAVVETDQASKFLIEEAALIRLSNLLPDDKRTWLYNLWLEYEEGKTYEARVVKALDKIETIMQHNQVDNGKDFDYTFNLDYGKKHLTDDQVIIELRKIIDEMTKENI